MPPVGLELTVSAGDRTQTYGLNNVNICLKVVKIWNKVKGKGVLFVNVQTIIVLVV